MWFTTPNLPRYSSIDYFIRGLVPRCLIPTGMPYFDRLMEEGSLPIFQIILRYGQTGTLTREQILDLVADDPAARRMIEEYVI